MARIDVSCDAHFTEFEVNEMNMLGLRYSLDCSLLDMDMLYPDTVARFDRAWLPSGPASRDRQPIHGPRSHPSARALRRWRRAVGQPPPPGEMVRLDGM